MGIQETLGTDRSNIERGNSESAPKLKSTLCGPIGVDSAKAKQGRYMDVMINYRAAYLEAPEGQYEGEWYLCVDTRGKGTVWQRLEPNRQRFQTHKLLRMLTRRCQVYL